MHSRTVAQLHSLWNIGTKFELLSSYDRGDQASTRFLNPKIDMFHGQGHSSKANHHNMTLHNYIPKGISQIL